MSDYGYRVTTEEVKVLLPVPSSVTDLSAFISLAHELVEKVIVTPYPDAHTEAWLTEIEKWLSAHFAAIRYTRTSSESIGEVSEAYQYKVDLDLRCTMYGQQAILLDTTGTLSRLGKTRTASIGWIGNALPDDQSLEDDS